MKIRTDALVAVGAAVKSSQQAGVALSDIAAVRLDGTEVDVGAATAALDKASVVVPDGPPGFITRSLDALETRAQSMDAKLETTALGKRLMTVIKKDPERVAREGLVEIALKDGRTLEIPVVIVSRSLSAALQRVSIGASALAMTPIIGTFVAGGTAICSGLAALIAAAVGNGTLATSLGGMATKHATLCAVGFVPVLSNLAGVVAIVVDRADLKELRRPVSVADIVNLSAHAPPPSA